MKKIHNSLKNGFTLITLLVICTISGQTINTTFKTQINAKLAGLDKTKVPNKLLINQAMEFAEFSDYNGVITATNWATKGKFTSIYNTLLMSRVQTEASLVSPTVFKTNWDNLRAENKIVLSGLYYKYSKFKPNAFPNFLVNNAGVVTDKYVSGVWQNPYEDKQVFAVATPILIYKNLSLQVTLPASLWYTNQASAVQSIAIDFGNGSGYLPMTLGQVRTINYATAGIYEWKYKLTLTNSQILYSHSKLNIDIPVLPPPPTNPTSTSQTIQPNGTLLASQAIVNPPPAGCNDVAIVPFTGTRQYLGLANSATLQIKYSQNDCIIRKPLIVVEGFDSGLLGVENPFGEVSYRDFIYSIYNSSSYDLYKAIYSNNNSLDNYDIIYINYNKGRDDLKRNAYLVEDVIKWVNTKKAQAGSTTPNVVIGQSMGGVIGRYALRDMEMLGQAHQTSLFVSHDAPQQGANIPVGIQYFARHLADQFIDTPLGDYKINLAQGANISIEDIQTLFDSPGTRQLLSNYIDSGFNLNNNAFNAFQSEIRTMGYPLQTRNIALSNGNHCANTQEFNPSATLFSLTGGASTTALTTFLTTLLQPITNIPFIWAAYEFNEPGLLLGLLPGSSSFSMGFNASALPTAGTSSQVYHGDISYTKVLFDFFGWRPQITVVLTDRTYSNPVNLSYDYYPGGKYQLPFNFASSTVNNTWINVGINAYLAPSFNFIPVPSALDIGSGSTPLNNADYLRKYNTASPPLAPKNSPFANFTTSFPNGTNTNEPHISFNTRNGNWLAKEIDNILNNNDSFNCTYICSDNQITGLNLLCSTSTYSIPTTAGVNVYNWTITQGANLVSVSGNNSQTVTLTPLPNASGLITLSLTMGDNGARCGNVILTKKIWVGIPAFNFSRGTAQSEFCDTKFHYVPFILNMPPEAGASINIQYLYPNVTYSQNATNVYTFNFPKGYSGPFNITATITNPCGSYFIESEGEHLIANCFSIPYGNRGVAENETIFKVFPNPSNDIVSIDLKDQENQLQTIFDVSGELFDMMGQSKSIVEIINNKATFSVQGLPKGIYVLKIYVNGQVESHQIAVQ